MLVGTQRESSGWVGPSGAGAEPGESGRPEVSDEGQSAGGPQSSGFHSSQVLGREGAGQSLAAVLRGCGWKERQ